jgi:signal transduction histidine kinase
MTRMGETPSKADILVVDDTRANLRFLAEILTQQGYAVRPALNGPMALSSAQARLPDLILLDIMMPQMDGYEVCGRLKADARTRDIPVIFLSALNEVVDKVRAFEIGGVDYITKPFQVQEVLARVETHLTLCRLQRRLREKNEMLTHEVTERKRAQAALERYAEELEASNAELDAFAHTVAHDLKAPLTAMLGFGALLQRRYDRLSAAEVHERLGMIMQTGEKLNNIVDELLLLASVRKMEEITLHPLDMAPIVTESQGRLRSMIARCGAEIVVPETWPPSLGYAPWIEEVWVNYISNAIKYGGEPDNGVPPHVELGYDEGPPVRFWCRDNGGGLTQVQQAKLFTQFTRLHEAAGATEIRAGGYGLGLSIVQRIVEKLGGQVGVESAVGQGSTFWFTLPCALGSEE